MTQTATKEAIRIALFGSDERLLAVVSRLLAAESYETETLGELGPAVEAWRRSGRQPDVLVVAGDYPLDELKAYVGKIKRQCAAMPVFVLHSSATLSQLIDILDGGADECVDRNFKPALFLARLRVLLRRRLAGREPQREPVSLELGPVSLNLLERIASVDRSALTLTRMEFDLLAYLMKHAGNILTREDLLQTVWNYPPDVETRTLDKHVALLRKKLGKHGDLIETCLNVGYRFKLPRAARQ